MRPVLSLAPLMLLAGIAHSQGQRPETGPKLPDCAVFTNQHDRISCELESADITKQRTEIELRKEELSISPNCSIGEFWKAHQTTDPMTDKKACSVSPAVYVKQDGGLLVLVQRSGISFTTMGDKYPGEESRIRVDKHKAFTFENSLQGGSARALLSQLSSGTMVLTEYMDWPYNLPNVRSVPVCDLLEKIESCNEFIR